MLDRCNAMGHSEIRVIIARPVAEVFATYAQPDPWRWTGLSKVRWTEGRPWEVGSRLHFEPDDAHGVVCDQVLTQFKPNSHVSFISHFGGITMQSHVRFRTVSENVTEILSHSEFMGTFSRIAGYPLRAAIGNGAKQFYEDLKRECEGPGTGRHPQTGMSTEKVKEESEESGS